MPLGSFVRGMWKSWRLCSTKVSEYQIHGSLRSKKKYKIEEKEYTQDQEPYRRVKVPVSGSDEL